MIAAAPLSRRLLAAALVWLAAALAGAFLLLGDIFRDHAARGLEARLLDDMDHLAAALEPAPDGALALTRPLPDSRYDRPYSGRYWQVETEGREPLRARSLWDAVLPNPPDALRDGEIHRHEFAGPAGQTLVAVERNLAVDGTAARVRLVVAADAAEIAAAVDAFRGALALSLAILGAGLALAAVLQVRYGLAPLRRLRAALAAFEAGKAGALDGAWPREIAPLVADLDALLARNRALVERARSEAANLAHALKTPLAVLRNEAGTPGGDLPGTVRRQVDAMQGHVERHLARARAGAAAATQGKGTDARAVAIRLCETLGKLHPGRSIGTSLSGTGLVFAGAADDLADILGNLLDNALKWARGEVRLSLSRDGGMLAVDIEDDGPGIAPESRAAVLRRGLRLDESMPGTGFGLAVADELVALYKGSLELGTSGLGGLRVTLRLPAG